MVYNSVNLECKEIISSPYFMISINHKFMKSCPEIFALHRPVLNAKWSSGHAAGYVSKYIHIYDGMQSESAIQQRNPEYDQVEGLEITHFYRQTWLACAPSPVLLFESKPIRSLLYESLWSALCDSTGNCFWMMKFECVYCILKPNPMISRNL